MTKSSHGQNHWPEKEGHHLKKNELYTSFLSIKAMHVFLESEGSGSIEKHQLSCTPWIFRREGKDSAHVMLASYGKLGSEG